MPKKQKQTKRMPADNRVRTSKQSVMELKENELNCVTGGEGPTESVPYAFAKVSTPPLKLDE